MGEASAALGPGRIFCMLSLLALVSCAGSGSSGSAGSSGESRPRGLGPTDRERQLLTMDGADQIQLRVVLAGRGPLLLLPTPGWGPSLEMYERTLRPLEEHFTVAYIDTRGTGESTLPGSAPLWNLENFAMDLDRVRHGLGRKTCFVFGHGTGTNQALAYAMTYPKPCQGLILVAATPNRGPEWGQAHRRRLRERAMRDAEFEQRVRMVHALQAAGPATEDAEARARLLALLPTMFADPRAFEANRAAFEAMTIRAAAGLGAARTLHGADLSSMLTLVRCPVLVVNGDTDHIAAPEDARKLERLLPKAETHIAKEAGHFPWLERADWFFGCVSDWHEKQG